MKAKRLIPSRRVCCVCGEDARLVARTPLRGEPVVLAVSFSLYRKTPTGKSGSVRPHAVRVCEGCMVRALSGSFFGAGSAGSKLWHGIRAALSEGYSALVDGDGDTGGKL